MIRLAWAYVVTVASTVFFGGTVAIGTMLRMPRFEGFADRATGRWARLILWGAGVRVVIKGSQHLGSNRGQILASNHQSWFDVFALAAALPVRYSFVGKKELSRIPFLGHAWEKVGHVAVDRGDHDSALASLQCVDGQVRGAGRTIIMFPEGTRSESGDLTRFKKGAFIMAIRAQVPIVPAAVIGTRRVMRKGSWSISPGRVTIRVGRPISTTGLNLRDRERLSRQVRAAIDGLRAAPPGDFNEEVGVDMDGDGEAGVACRPS